MKTMNGHCYYCGKSIEIEPTLTTTIAFTCYECFSGLWYEAGKQKEQEARQ